MSGSADELRSLLREELNSALSGVRNDVQRLQTDLAEAMSRISSLERSGSGWPSPRSALRSSSSEPARKSPRGSVVFTLRSQHDESPVSGDTLILNTFPEKVSRDEIKAWLAPLVLKLVGDVEWSLSSRTRYSTRVFLRFVSPMRAKAFSAEWRKENRFYGSAGAQTRIFINWKLSPGRAREEFLHRQFFMYAKEVLQLNSPPLEKERATRTIYYDRVLIAKVEEEKVVLTEAGKTYANVAKFQAWLEEKEKQRQSL